MKQKALRKIVEFYSQEHKEAYKQFCEYIGGRSEQGMIRALIVFSVARPHIMNAVLEQYDSTAIHDNTMNIA